MLLEFSINWEKMSKHFRFLTVKYLQCMKKKIVYLRSADMGSTQNVSKYEIWLDRPWDSLPPNDSEMSFSELWCYFCVVLNFLYRALICNKSMVKIGYTWLKNDTEQNAQYRLFPKCLAYGKTQSIWKLQKALLVNKTHSNVQKI